MRHRNAPPRRLHSAREGLALDWDPMSLGGLTAWFRADDVVLNGSTVSRWNDRSGNGRHANQGTAANQPTWNATDASFNGQASMTFDGVNDYLVGSATLANLVTASTDHCFMVFLANAANAGVLWNAVAIWGDAAAYAAVSVYNTPAVVSWIVDGGTPAATKACSLGAATNAIRKHVGGQLTTTVNGSAGSSVAAGNIQSLAGSVNIARSNGGAFLNGKIAELVFTNQDNTPSLAQWATYVNKRYGL